MRELFNEDLATSSDHYIYFGDSANDEPMFEQFKFSVGVANVADFLPSMTHHPTYICTQHGGFGFAEAMEHILAHRVPNNQN